MEYSEKVVVRIASVSRFLQHAKAPRQWQPKPSVPTAEIFVRECRSLPVEHDIMGIRGTYHRGRVAELVHNFSSWRDERVPGTRAFQSKYDR